MLADASRAYDDNVRRLLGCRDVRATVSSHLSLVAMNGFRARQVVRNRRILSRMAVLPQESETA
jgi:hypothetical protein